MLRRLIGLVSLSAMAVMAMAGPQSYAQRVQNIRAGVVILASAKTNAVGAVPQSAGPYALYNLDSNTTVKPAGWNFYNPYAPTRVTPNIFSRWSTIDPATTPPVGTRISKQNAAYWEVFLGSLTDQALGNYDFLVVNPTVFASLNPSEQLRLRRFVDNGGVLWIDPDGLNASPFNSAYGNVDQFNNFPFPFSPLSVNSILNPQADFSNSLLSCIQSLNSGDLASINAPAFSNYLLNPVDFTTDGASSNLNSIAGGTITDFLKLQTVSFVAGLPAISIGRIGEGVVVITARGASVKLNRTTAFNTYTANHGFTGLSPVLGPDGIASAKLAVNMVGLLRTSRQQAGGSRKVSSNVIDLNPPLLSRSVITPVDYSSHLNQNGNSQSTPALYKGLLVTTVDGVLKVYDSNPATDIDGDGNPDDGIQDYSVGAPYDEIWESVQLPGPLSAPVCAEVVGGPGTTPHDEVLVTDSTGTLYIFNLMPRKSDGSLAGHPNGQSSGGFSWVYKMLPPNTAATLNTSLTGVPLAPTVHEGIAYMVDNVQKSGSTTGQLWQVDLQTGSYVLSTVQSVSNNGGRFVLGGGESTVGFPEFTYGATVGYIPIADSSGGVDKVLYAPFAPNVSSGVNACGFVSVWLGARGEVPMSYSVVGSDLEVSTRVSGTNTGLPIYLGNQAGLGPKITLLDSSGNPKSDVDLGKLLTGSVSGGDGGILKFGLTPLGVSTFDATVSAVRIDYTVDWGRQSQSSLIQVERGRLLMPDVAQGPSRVIAGGVALSPQGTAYVVSSSLPGSATSAPPSPYGGGLYGFREQGQGQFKCVSRYELYGPNTITLNQASNVTDSGVLTDSDYLITYLSLFPATSTIATALSQTMTHYEIRGGPAIRNGQVFVTASATKSSLGGPFPVPVTILMAFNAEPQPASFVIGDLPDGTQILQSDFARSTNSQSPENQSAMSVVVNSSNGYTYDASTGVISFPSLMSNPTGQILNCMSLSQPIIVRKPGASDYVVYPDSIGGAVWNPLQWYTVMDGAYPSGGAPLVTGNSVFLACDSFLPAVLNGFSGIIPPTTGMLYGVSAQIGASQLHASATKPWLNQLWSVDPISGGITGDPNILWPHMASVTSPSDYGIKLNQTLLTGSHLAYGLAGGDNALAAWGDNGLFTFAKSNVLVCDEGRIIEMDGSGNPIWSTDSSASTGPSAINASANMKPLIRPSRAYLLNDTTILVADPGANRVATVTKNGIEQRSISSFQLDPGIPANGYTPGETLNLSGPRDALYYSTFTNMGQASSLVTMGDGENASNDEYWQHYLIADTGNKRLVEVVDRFYYDPVTGMTGQPVTVGGVPQVGVLIWHSPLAASGKQYSYSSLSRVKLPDANGGHFVYVTGIGGTFPTRVGTGLDAAAPSSAVDANDGTGGIVIYDPANPAGVVTISQISLPDVSNTAFWNPASLAFDNTIDQSTTQGQQAYARRKGGIHRLSNLSSVTAKVVGNGLSQPATVAIMVADASGVYEVTYSAALASATSLTVDWMMPNEVYRVIQQSGSPGVPTVANAQELRAMYARRLDSGEVLIVNGYYGYCGYYAGSNFISGVPFNGEVMQVNGGFNNGLGSYNPTAANLGFNSASITLDLRTAGATGLRGLVLPVFADRR